MIVQKANKAFFDFCNLGLGFVMLGHLIEMLLIASVVRTGIGLQIFNHFHQTI